MNLIVIKKLMSKLDGFVFMIYGILEIFFVCEGIIGGGLQRN